MATSTASAASSCECHMLKNGRPRQPRQEAFRASHDESTGQDQGPLRVDNTILCRVLAGVDHFEHCDIHA